VIRAFLDAGVFIAAIRGEPHVAERVLAILNDPERAFMASHFVCLEVLPKIAVTTRESGGFQGDLASGNRGISSRA
jgi:hypothetical protein